MTNIYEILKNIDNGLKLNTSFREYFIMFDDCFIGVNPFAIQHYIYDKESIKSYNYFKIKNHSIKFYHHNDYRLGEISFTPCDIYEDVSGVKIHTEDEYEYDLSDSKVCEEYDRIYKINQTKFVNFYNNRIRSEKLDRILND
jgi:hypothetical protein